MKKLFFIFIFFLYLNYIKVGAQETISNMEAIPNNSNININEETKWEFVHKYFEHNAIREDIKKVGWRLLYSIILGMIEIHILSSSKFNAVEEKISNSRIIKYIERDLLNTHFHPTSIMLYIVMPYILVCYLEKLRNSWDLRNKNLLFLKENLAHFPVEIQEEVLKLKELSQKESKISYQQAEIINSIRQKVYKHFKEDPTQIKISERIGLYTIHISGLVMGAIASDYLKEMFSFKKRF